MSYVSHLQGLGSRARYPADAVMNLCPADGRPVAAVLDLERLRAERGATGWYTPARRGMWRFGGLLALDYDDPADQADIVSLGEGGTPLVPVDEGLLGLAAGLRLELKLEGRPVDGYGANPTGSFKDRGMAMVVSMARRLGLERLAVPTQGNAGDSLARYALAAGLEAIVVMPRDTPAPIMRRVEALSRDHAAIRYELVDGTIREAGVRVRERWLGEGYFSVATFQDPGWRIEGKKTLGLEIAEPRTRGGPWTLPDAVVYPTGGGTGLLGMWKAFDELERLGLVDERRPRMIAVQSEVTAPLVEAFAEGWPDTRPAEAGHTLAVGLNVPGGVGHFRVLEILRASGGGAVTVSEAEIRRAMAWRWPGPATPLSPEGAAALAAVPALLERGLIHPGEHVVVFETGSPEKYATPSP
jgi:threonine synthase